MFVLFVCFLDKPLNEHFFHSEAFIFWVKQLNHKIPQCFPARPHPTRSSLLLLLPASGPSLWPPGRPRPPSPGSATLPVLLMLQVRRSRASWRPSSTGWHLAARTGCRKQFPRRASAPLPRTRCGRACAIGPRCALGLLSDSLKRHLDKFSDLVSEMAAAALTLGRELLP